MSEPTPAQADEKARGAQERADFERWAAKEWQNSSPPDSAWKGWIARAQVADRAALRPEGEAVAPVYVSAETLRNLLDGVRFASVYMSREPTMMDPVALFASPPAPAGAKAGDIAEGLKNCDWSGASKAQRQLILEAIEALLPPSTEAQAGSFVASASVRPEPGSVEKLRTHARAMSDALTKVRPLAGSEMFSRVGEEFYADPSFCGAEIERLRAENIELRKRVTRAERASPKSEPSEREP
jgi:hypothetical protein